MPDSAIATAADYADAMMTARRAKNVLLLLLLLVVLIQLALFFTARYTDIIIPRGTPAAAVDVTTTTQPEVAEVSDDLGSRRQQANWRDVFHYVLGCTIFLGIGLTLVLAVVLLLIVTIMLVGRLIGVARTTSAFIWCLVLFVLMFPWQALLRDEEFTSREWIWPGVLYTWHELTTFARFPEAITAETVLHWARFVAFPVVALILLLVIQVKSNRGMREALGENVYSRTDPANQI